MPPVDVPDRGHDFPELVEEGPDPRRFPREEPDELVVELDERPGIDDVQAWREELEVIPAEGEVGLDSRLLEQLADAVGKAERERSHRERPRPAAENVARPSEVGVRFKDEDLPARAGEPGRGEEASEPGADDDDVLSQGAAFQGDSAAIRET